MIIFLVIVVDINIVVKCTCVMVLSVQVSVNRVCQQRPKKQAAAAQDDVH